jgi:murein DD-endopeptidase MepM/ murein hydrolase activator NlpD
MSYRSTHSHDPRLQHHPAEGWAHGHPQQQYQQAPSRAPKPAALKPAAPKHAAPKHAAPKAAAPKPAAPHPSGKRGRKSADYTLVHAGRQVRVGPVAFWIAVGSLVIMAGWSVMTGTYFAFHDDVLKRLIARQAEMQYGYEDRIAELRGKIDRLTSRQLLDQEQFEQKLDQIARRQQALESRASALSGLPEMGATGSIRQPARGDATRHAPLKPSPINDTGIFRAPPDRHAAKARGGVEGMLMRMQDSLDRVERKQLATLGVIEERYDVRSRRIRGVLSELGIDSGKAPPPAAVGGPYVPAQVPAESFERHLYRVNVSRAHVERLQRTLLNVPVRKPVDGEIDYSSGFGMRVDPFLRSPAMHTGLDMRGETGSPARATANGKVTIAGVNGGYGKMVEVDHGNGLTTRYAHLSAIEVRVGQGVRIGQIVGRIGSTGRSTGPHLHYETRVDGDPVDPQKYLRAGARLSGL